MDTTNKLDELFGINERIKLIRDRREKMIENAVPEEVKKKIQEVKEEFPEPIELMIVAGNLQKEIADETIAKGETIKGKHLMAVFSKGRTSFDLAKLEGYAVAHPEIDQFKKFGEPSVSIRGIK